VTEPLLETTDLGFAAYLRVIGVPLTMRWEGDRGVWVSEQDLRGAMDAYLLKRATVVALDYSRAIRDLKDILHLGA